MTRSLSMKKKIDSAATELEQYHHLFEYIRSRSEVDAAEVYRRLRASDDPLSVWRFLKDGDLLLQTRVSNASRESPNPVDFENLDRTALQASPFKLGTAPWSTVAGSGLVSELISSFIAYDNGFLFSFIDVQFFLADLMAGKPDESEWCSPCLVNAICALRCVSRSYCRDHWISADVASSPVPRTPKRLVICQALSPKNDSMPRLRGCWIASTVEDHCQPSRRCS